ncbi:MAG: type II secretion system protein [Rhodocyclaceae bacterium]
MFHIPPSRTPTCRQSGFTLMEVLVALAITSLLMTLLMGANYYILRTQDTLAREAREGEQGMRALAWYRQLVGGLAPVGEEVADAFEGDERGFRAITLRPLRAETIVAPEAISLRFERDVERRT